MQSEKEPVAIGYKVIKATIKIDNRAMNLKLLCIEKREMLILLHAHLTLTFLQRINRLDLTRMNLSEVINNILSHANGLNSKLCTGPKQWVIK